MSRPVDWTPLAERDPVPGDPDRLETAARHYKRVAEAIDLAATKLRRLAEHADMQSEAVDTFRGNALKVAENIGRAHERYAAVTTALTTSASDLRDAQVDSVSAGR